MGPLHAWEKSHIGMNGLRFVSASFPPDAGYEIVPRDTRLDHGYYTVRISYSYHSYLLFFFHGYSIGMTL